MTPTDTGPLVALVDRRDPYHPVAVRTAADLPDAPLVTTWPCLTEAMYLAGESAGFPGQEALWRLLSGGRLVVRDPTPPEVGRMAELMRQYRDLPMDLADASLVAAAEVTRNRRLFTFDGDFRVYCLADGSTLDVIPDGPAE
ncbi:MAG: PIN domain-containing protein [Gemmataceae bacterium]|nr:PIN domain-containing protein [Gemmataceae bacterium]